MTFALLAGVLCLLWFGFRRAFPPEVIDTDSVSERWLKEHIYLSGKQEDK